MVRRKINLQDVTEAKVDEPIDNLVRELGTTDLGFAPTDQVVYEINLDRINPDPTQPRSFLPHDLKAQLQNGELTSSDVLAELLARAEQGNQLAKLILGGRPDLLNEDDPEEEDTGLLALARSIKDVGLRQPINVYSVTKANLPGEPYYRIGEGERRYWAHHLLVHQGHSDFGRVRAIIEPLPDDETLIMRRQQAENAARQDLSAVARARSIQQIRDRLQLELGTRVPGETTIKLPSGHELDEAVGQEVKSFTGRAIGGRMVRNYLRLLKLSAELQDLAEAAMLTEKQLRPVLRLKTDADQHDLISRIINEKLSGRAVLSTVAPPPTTSLRRVAKTTVEQRLEKRLLQAATTAYEVLSLGRDSYAEMLAAMSGKVNSREVKESLLALRQMIDELVAPDDSSPDLDSEA